MIDPRRIEASRPTRSPRAIKRNASMIPRSIPFSLFQRDESRRKKKNEERKAHAVYRVLRAIHTDVIPTPIPFLFPLVEGREKFPMRIGKGGSIRPLFHICMHVVIPPLENSSRSGNAIRIRTFLELIRSDDTFLASNEIRYYSPSRITGSLMWTMTIG